MIKFTQSEKKMLTQYIKLQKKAKQIEGKFVELLEKYNLTGEEYACEGISNGEIDTVEEFENLLEEFG